jgi:hypothetical protein
MSNKGRNLHYTIVPFEYDNKIISKATDFRIYRDTIIITPGEYSDSMTRTPTVYDEYELKLGAENWSANYLNLDHCFDVLSRVGFVKNPHWRKGAVRGDLYITPFTNAGKDVIAQIDAGLVNSLSAELTTNDIWDNKENIRKATNIEFIGAAIVLYPACGDARIR